MKEIGTKDTNKDQGMKDTVITSYADRSEQ